ncbi:conserved membrane hypothetical protein [Sulfurovum sp. enrichment culture clone C5]|uniref:General glycosylation pathway protein n=1 Tax=Sulfurovum sp. enrichment culture clone C5 TaxID=497650 RepID=A0A0S4XMZ0_9BACT|nr:conserved membrane hypothetical protein [Sulfurovum sp. enrichment culture clone C5]
MKEFIDIYRQNTNEIEQFIYETLENIGNLERHKKDNYKKLFDIFPSLELVYETDNEKYIQTSPNLYRNKTSSTPIGRDRRYLIKGVSFKNSDVAFTKPYVSSATKNTCITAIKQENDQMIYMDFDLSMLLQRLGFLELHSKLNILNKSFYGGAGLSMVILAIFTIGYALVSFFHTLLFEANFSIEAIFKPVVALTLGLAIFDLAKTILEQEVFFKSYSKDTKNEYRLLIKFLITIIIALLIEALMVVFKIAISDYTQLINAFYLILGVSIIIISLSIFVFLSQKVNNSDLK